MYFLYLIVKIGLKYVGKFYLFYLIDTRIDVILISKSHLKLLISEALRA